MNVIAGPLPCSGCHQLVVYGLRMDRGNPPRAADTLPLILDHPAGTAHRCTGPDVRPIEDHLTITWRRYA